MGNITGVGTEIPVPRVFISYSWTAQQWTITLAERLVQDSRVDVVLDVWDLREGNDKFKFMERMVQDQAIDRVLIICDREYANKANNRTGGVGTETQILTAEVYGSVAENKFIPVIRERDADGNAYLPHYLKPRIYIDLSDALEYEDKYEDLVRAIYNKPRHSKPPLGPAPPDYIVEEKASRLPTSHKLRAFQNAILEGRPSAAGLAGDFLSALGTAFETISVVIPTGQTPIDDLRRRTLESIEGFKPYRDEFVKFVLLVSKYGSDVRVFEALRSFFSGVALYLNRTVDPASHATIMEDNFRLLIGELFLYSIAAMLKHSRHSESLILLAASYQDYRDRQNNSIAGYEVFELYMPNLDTWHRQSRAPAYDEGNYATIEALTSRADCEGISYEDIADADYLLFARQFLNPSASRWRDWAATTLVGTRRMALRDTGMPSFVRATAHADFQKLSMVLGVVDKEELLAKFDAACDRLIESRVVFAGRNRCNLHRLLMNIDKLDTM